MTTQILSLPVATIAQATRTNEDWRDAVAFYDGSSPAPGNPIDLTGISFHLQLRGSAADARVWLDASTDPANGRLVVGGASGNVLGFAVPEAVMSAIPPGSYVYDIVASADGIQRVVAPDCTVTHSLGETR